MPTVTVKILPCTETLSEHNLKVAENSILAHALKSVWLGIKLSLLINFGF